MATVQKLSRLEKVELRKIFLAEATYFTPWLAEEENLKLLGDTIGMELEMITQEKEVGPYRADLLCRNTADSSLVLIENQIEKTDHLHLGQLMTYAAGLEAATIVWIASRFVDEHRAAMDWLNEITGEKFAFFGLEIELFKIGDSVPAPKFNIVCKPNDFTKGMQRAAASSELSETKAKQLSFWIGFRSYMEAHDSVVKCQKPLPQHWMNHSIGRSGVHMCSIASTWDSATGSYGPEIRVELYLDGEKAKPWFEALLTQKASIESELGYPLVWHNPDTTKMSKMYVRKSADINDEKLWPDQYKWLHSELERFTKVFKSRIKALS